MPKKEIEYRIHGINRDHWAKCLALWRIEGHTAVAKFRYFIRLEAERFDKIYQERK